MNTIEIGSRWLYKNTLSLVVKAVCDRPDGVWVQYEGNDYVMMECRKEDFLKFFKPVVNTISA